MDTKKNPWLQNAKDPQWCLGCGDFGELASLVQGLSELGIEPHKTIIAGGIGCAGQMPQYLNGYSIKIPHGRVLPTILGLKLVRPDMTVIGLGGDGDAWAIGAGHFVNFPGWNIDTTYIVTDNEVYGLTRGQLSPTAPTGLKTKMAPQGGVKPPINPVAMALDAGWTFVARAISVGEVNGISTKKLSTEIIKRAIQHKGSSLIVFETECPTHNKQKTGQWMRERAVLVDTLPGYDPEDINAAHRLAMIPAEEKLPIGIYYQVSQPTLHEKLGITEPLLPEVDKELIEKAMKKFE